MHRAQKASSKLCHDREVEKAQELHKRKIDGVKSSLTAITRPPAPSVPASNKTSRPSTFFRRSLRQHASVPNALRTAEQRSSVPKSGLTHDHNDAYSDDDGGGGSSDDDGSDEASLIGDGNANDEVATKSFGKLDELRSVLVPVMAYKGHKTDPSELDYEQYLDAITNPPRSVHEPPKPEPIHQSTHSLRASAFRMRRLKQIETDNLTIFERIKNSTAHYRTDSLKKDWEQNVGYLTSICAFPVVEEALHAPPRRTTYTRKRSPFGTRLPDQLPSLQLDSPPVMHPIKAIPTSPKKTNALNLSPAFRSLRKGLPQVPALPPLSASPRPAHAMKVKSMTAVASSRASIHFDEASKNKSSPPRRSPTPPLRTGTMCADAVADDSSRYTLLKIGRFIGGKYLILTVFCGDGITNPYGFDVVAQDPEVHVEFNLSVTKETTHLLLETISSSSMAERTAAAAGTNLSMELIARCICDHIQYARTGNSEVVFLVATVGNPGGLHSDTGGSSDEEQLHHSSQVSGSDNASLLVDTMYAAMTFCFHQYVQIPRSAANKMESTEFAHVFVSTRPQQCCRASMREADATPTTPEHSVPPAGGAYNGLVRFEVYEDYEANPLPRPPIAQLQVAVSEVIRQFEDERVALGTATRERLSLDRFIMLSLQCLHFVKATDANPDLQLVLIPSLPNDWTCADQSPCQSPCRPSSTVLPNIIETRGQPHHIGSRQILPDDFHPHKIPSRLSAHDEIKNVLQTGMLWRGVYLFARIALVSPGSFDKTSGLVSREPLDELLVFNILNSSTGNYSERILHGDQVEALSQKLGAWQSTVGVIPPLVVFAKRLLLRMRLDVDLHGQEIILFPALEPRYHNAGGRSSPVTSSRRNSPMKQVLAHDEGLKTASHTTTYSLDSELQVQAKAARSIQALARQFLRRRRYRAAFPGSAGIISALDESLPSLILAFVRKRAAKRIQFATRKYKERAVRRRRTHDLNGVKISTPRALTPTATAKGRSSSSVSPQVPLNALQVDENSAVGPALSAFAVAIDQPGESDDIEDDDDQGDGDSRSNHVDILGILPEDDQEEEEDESNQINPHHRRNDGISTEEATALKKDREPKPSFRVGKKAHDRFVLEQHAIERGSGSPSQALEHRIIGALGQLQSEY